MLGQMVRGVLTLTPDVEVLGTTRGGGPGLLAFEASGGLEALRRLAAADGPFDLVVNAIGVRHERIDPADGWSMREAIVANALLPHELAAWSEECGARVVHVSTDGVFPPDAGVCFEDTPRAAPDPYGQTKSLGEPTAAGLVSLRCSLVGPDPIGRHGLLEWLLSRPPKARVPGYTDHSWSGVTSLQFATLCRSLVDPDAFAAVRAESAVHHYCPNKPVSKHELLVLLAACFRPDVEVEPAPGPKPVTRRLDTRLQSLAEMAGRDKPLRQAIEALRTHRP
jgi:dTDP-4-dehydrorhamnose reductase